MQIRMLRILMFGFAVGLVLSGCDDGATNKAAPLPLAKGSATPPVIQEVPADEQPVEEDYVYNPVGTRDPFKNPLGTLSDLPTTTTVPLTPLQKFDLDQLRVIGVIVGRGEPKAMVIAPDNKSFVLKKGTKIGRNNGSVVGITTEAILIEEQYLDFAGDIKTTMQEIKLPKQGGVK